MESNIFIEPKYAELVIELDKLKIKIAEKIAEKEILSSYIIPEIKNLYVLNIGVKEAELFLTKLNLAKITREIELYEKFVSNNEEIDKTHIEEIIKNEFDNEYMKYDLMKSEIEEAVEFTKRETLKEEALANVNFVLKELVNRLCPLINCKNGDLENNLYKLVIDSYKAGNFKKLVVIKLFCDKNNLGFKVDVDEYEDLDKLKQKYLNILEGEKKEIFNLRSSEMFSNKAIVENENLIRRRKDELQKHIDSILDEYNKALKKLAKLKLS